jgi:hypothetical protein
MNYPDSLPHDPPKKIATDLFVVHGCVQPSAVVRFSRNMAIVRHEGQLTLINPVRMDDEGLASLEALGEVAHVLRLGPMHGMDDAFYVDRYSAEFWSFEGGTTYTTPVITRSLSQDGILPFPNAKLFAFNHMTETEGAILLDRSPGILLTSDAIQSYATAPHTPHTNWFTGLLLPLIGFPRKTLIGPFWVKLLVEDRDGIKTEFERLLKLDFDQLLSAHGTFLENNAHVEVEQAFKKMFG